MPHLIDGGRSGLRTPSTAGRQAGAGYAVTARLASSRGRSALARRRSDSAGIARSLLEALDVEERLALVLLFFHVLAPLQRRALRAGLGTSGKRAVVAGPLAGFGAWRSITAGACLRARPPVPGLGAGFLRPAADTQRGLPTTRSRSARCRCAQPLRVRCPRLWRSRRVDRARDVDVARVVARVLPDDHDVGAGDGDGLIVTEEAGAAAAALRR